MLLDFLTETDILSRAFILLKPPFMSEQEGIYWAERSIDFAFEAGVECCTVIPVRPGNGAMEKLMDQGIICTSTKSVLLKRYWNME